MKSFLLICSLLTLAIQASAGTPKVSIQVQIHSERQDKERSSPDQSRAYNLIVRVTNPTSLPMEGLALKWALYADSLQRGTDEIVLEKAGEQTFNVAPSGRFTDVSTAQVVFNWTPQHSERSGSGRRVQFKKVDETGHRYHGYSVQVLQNGEVIGEAYSHASLKNQP